MRQGLIVLLFGLTSALASCGEAPQPPNGQVEVPGEDAPNAQGELDQNAQPDLAAPDTAVNPESAPGEGDSSAQGGASDLPPLDSEAAESPESDLPLITEPQDTELPLTTEPAPSEEAPPTE